ncbi:hypothetical protein GOP47_0017773 [Adiantum capillus-veneris]|nr:hypothetical protein GOP47_0017773 [Adiantum capillus-veneris]
MQTSANTAIVLDPSLSHLTDALCFKASSTNGHVLLTAGDSSGRESKEKIKGTKSSWFQRLKPLDDMVASETSKTEKGPASFDRLEEDARSVQPDPVSQNIGSKTRPNWQAESSPASKRQKTIEGKDYGGVESAIVQEKTVKNDVGRSIASSAAGSSTEMGFGPWLNLTFGRRCETEKTSAISKNVVGAPTAGHEFLKEVQGNSHLPLNALPECSLGITQAEATTAPVLCKPPLSPMHGKFGLPPRPPCQKLSGFHSTSKIASLACGPNRGISHEPAIENQSTGQTQTMSATVVLDVQDRESPKHGEATFLRVGSSFKSPKIVEGSISGSMWHSKVLTDCLPSSTRMDIGGVSSKQQPRLTVFERGNTSVTPGQHIGSCFDIATGKTLEDGVGEPVRPNVFSSTRGMDLQLKVTDSRTATSKSDSVTPAASLELSESVLQQSLTAADSHCRKMKVNEQVVKASTSATLPWELFIEPAGGSMKAREQFVEVYNRARDELKNQRLLQSTSRTLGGELDGGPKLTLGPGGAPSEGRSEGQSFSLEQHSSGPTKSQGKNMNLEHDESLPQSSILKEKNVMTAAESSQCKHVEGFRRVHPVPEGPLRLSHKIVAWEGNMEVSIQRVGEGSGINGKESRTGDNKGPSNQKDSVSKLGKDIKCTDLGQDPQESQKHTGGQEAVPVHGKRSRVTFENQAMSLGADKGAASRPRPQSKPHLWLQRWHATPKYKFNGLSADTSVASDGKRDDSSSYQTLGMKKFKDEDGVGVFGQGIASFERVKCLKTSSSKVLPSAAAMAIVGTAARQFCSLQPQGKGSFAFWSGFRIPTYRKVDEPAQEKDE